MNKQIKPYTGVNELGFLTIAGQKIEVWVYAQVSAQWGGTGWLIIVFYDDHNNVTKQYEAFPNKIVTHTATSVTVYGDINASTQMQVSLDNSGGAIEVGYQVSKGSTILELVALTKCDTGARCRFVT